MTISRMQQPRQMYGLGSFVKKAVKGVTGAVKSFAKSDLGKAALIGAAAFGIPGTSIGGLFGRASFMTPGGVGVKGLLGKTGIAAALPSVFGIPAGAPGTGTPGLFGKALNFLKTPGGAFAGITAASALAAAGLDPENPNEMPRNTEALKSYLRQGYLTLNPQAQPDEVEEFVEANTVEYRANGGRIGFAEGMLSFEEAKAMNPGMFSAEVETDVVRPNTELLNYIKRIRDAVEKGIIPMDFAMDLIKQKTMEQGVDLQDLRDDIMETQRIEQAYGGRIGFFKGAQADARAGRGAMSPGTSMSGGFRGGGDGGGNKDTTPKISEIVKNISNLSNVPAFEKISNLESKYGLGSSGLPSRARHMAAMNVLSNALSKTGLGVAMGIPSKLAGDMGAFGMGLINEIPALGRGLTKENLSEIGEDIADNFRGTFLTPNTMTTEQIYSNVYGRPGVRQGGRMQYAFGNPEQNAINAAGIMNLPLNQNPAGVTELDLRETGGFIPPVGVKEKADDIPAMLSNNEFVFTADAVKGMGDGDVNKGAQRMYDMMKKLEGGGRV
jgi:hypothetical protein